MYVSMCVYVPGGALRPKRCVIEAPNSPRAAFFSFLIFATSVLPALHSSEPPDFSPPFLPPALIARFPAFLLGMRVTCWESNLLPEIGHPLTCASQIREQLRRSRETLVPPRDQLGGSVTFQSEKDKDALRRTTTWTSSFVLYQTN